MKIEDIEIGDLVVITDGSYAVRVDSFEKRTFIGRCRDEFEVVSTDKSGQLKGYNNCAAHDIFIKNTVSGEMYLHSSAFVKKVEKCECVCRCCKCCNR